MRFTIRPGVRRLLRFPIRTRAAMKRDADDELEALIASRVEHLVARGMSLDDARAEAVRRLGASLDEVRLQLHTNAERRERRMRIIEFIESVAQDVRYAARGLARRPGFTSVAVLTLAIGVGATTALFSALNVLLLRPLPYARPEELMKVSLVLPAESGHPTLTPGLAYSTYTAIRDGQRSFTDIAGYFPMQMTLTSGDVERVDGEYVSASYLRTLGLAPQRGRDFDRSLDANAGGSRDAIISHRLWQRRFQADPSILGRVVDIDRQPWTIVGVAPRDFRGLSGEADIFLPLVTVAGELDGPGSSLLSIVARRAPATTASRAEDEMATLGGRAANEFPNRMGKLAWEVHTAPLDRLRLDPLVKRSLLILFGATWLVLAIACVNVASLLLGRASARRREIAVRIAIGAGRARLMRLLLVESLLLALLGGVASTGIAWIGARVLASVDPTAIFGGSRGGPTIGAVAFSSIALDWHVLAFGLATSLVVGVLFGLAPALAATRASLSDVLKIDRAAPVVGVGRRVLVVAQVALALVLLVGSGLMVRSLAKLLSVDVGFDAANVVTFEINRPAGSVAVDSLTGFYSQLLDRVRAVPGVADAGLDNCVPFIGGPCMRVPLVRSDDPTPDAIPTAYSGMEVVTPNWFSLMHVPLVRGRGFSPADRRNAPTVVLLNESAAKAFFGGDDPIGKRIALGPIVKSAQVIGIVGDIRQMPDSAPFPTSYLSSTQFAPAQTFVFVRSSRAGASIGGELRRAVREVAPQLAVFDMQTLAQREGVATARNRFHALLLTTFGTAALLLAAIGIYGVLSFAVTARTREMGIRIALGGERGSVQRLVIREGLVLVAVGVVIGLAGALAAARLLRTFLFDLTPTDPATYGAIVVVLVGTAALASWAPGRRASRVDPVIALRAE